MLHTRKKIVSVENVEDRKQACHCYPDLFTGDMTAILMDASNVKTC